MAGGKRGGAPKKKPGKKYSFSREVENEPDTAWREWFLSIERRKKEAADPKRKPWVYSAFDKEGEAGSIIRRKGEPLSLTTYIKRDRKKSGRTLDVDFLAIESAWKNAVGKEITDESAVFSFKNGVLTIAVYSSSLLQEIRQFHQAAILRDLRDIWSASQPLVKILYKLGKR